MLEYFPPKLYYDVDIDNYEPFVDIERCVHIQDVLDYHRNTLSPTSISGKDQSHLQNRGFCALWFGISSDPNSHHVYGNVSFTIKLQTLLDTFRSSRRLYYLETVERKDSVMSRLIFTFRDMNEVKPAIRLDMKQVGYPLYQDNRGTYHHLKCLPGYKHGHNLEILIDMPSTKLNEAQWLFDNCRKIPVNHQMANSRNYQNGKYKLCQCFKYNNKQKPCPHPFTAEGTSNHLNTACPAFLNSSHNARSNLAYNESTRVPVYGLSQNHSSYNFISPGRTSQSSALRYQPQTTSQEYEHRYQPQTASQASAHRYQPAQKKDEGWGCAIL